MLITCYDPEQVGDLGCPPYQWGHTGGKARSRGAVETQQQDRVFILDEKVVRGWQCTAGASQKYLRRERIARQELEQPLSQRRTSRQSIRHGCADTGAQEIGPHHRQMDVGQHLKEHSLREGRLRDRRTPHTHTQQRRTPGSAAHARPTAKATGSASWPAGGWSVSPRRSRGACVQLSGARVSVERGARVSVERASLARSRWAGRRAWRGSAAPRSAAAAAQTSRAGT
eukprot:COSAG01_NODE_533_length_15816_cov_4.518738_23_plen_228_part_00